MSSFTPRTAEPSLHGRLKLLELQIKLSNLLKHAQSFLCLLLINLAHREANMDQHIVTNTRFIFPQHADVDVSLYPAYFYFGDGILLVNNFHNLARYGQAHLLD